MSRPIHAAVAALAAGAAPFAFAGSPPADPPAPVRTAAGPAHDYAAFGLGLYRELAGAAPESNVIVSPVSAGLALSIVANGAGGTTLDGMLGALAAGADTAALNAGNAALLQALASDDLELSVASALWARDGVPFLASFLATARGPYGARVETADLTSREMVERVNAWAAESTRDRIPTVLEEPLDAQAVLFLANAVYFKGRWLDEFRPTSTRPRPFHTPSGTVEHPRMHRTARYAHLRGEGFQAVRLPYRGDRFAMYVLLPDSGSSLAALRERATREAWAAWMAGFQTVEVELSLPRFRLETTAGLIAPLSAMGMEDAFAPSEARFDAMVEPAWLRGRNLFVSRAQQKVFIEVSEEGTEAAAVTTVTVSVESVPPPPVPFVVDRPFLFAIRDDHTGALLFLGQVVDPAG